MDPASDTSHSSTPSFDMDRAASAVMAELGIKTEETTTETDETPLVEEASTTEVETPTEPTTTTEAEVTTTEAEPPRPVPKTWPKEMHPHWEKTPKEVQTYWETREQQMLSGLEAYKGDATFGKTLREVITPYQPIIQAQGLDAPKAVQYLLNAHYRLTNGSLEERKAAYDQLGKNLGFVEASDAATDPKVQTLEQKLTTLEQHIQAQAQAAFQERQSKVQKDVDAFAADPAHLYFEEVSDDMVAMIRAGSSLQEAYDKAVWANPVTRQKEIARLQTKEREDLKTATAAKAQKAQQASSVNVKHRDTNRTPTEPLGTMDDTIRATWKAMQSRVS